jgi:hypothetical protein
MDSSLDIIIVNWNAGHHLRDCMDSVVTAKREGFTLSRVVVVDNASTDGSADGLEYSDLPLTVIKNPENRGFAAACNQGAAGTDADYLLFLNPDTKLNRDSLSAPIIFMEQPDYARVGICGITLLDETGKPSTACARFPTLTIFISEMLGLPRVFPQVFPPHIMLSKEIFHSREVDQVMGAFFLIRTKLFVSLGGMDERFFLYFEEVDLSLRAKELGYTSYYLSNVAAYHAGRVCSKQVSSAALFYSLSSRFKYACSHYRSWECITLILLTFSVEFASRMFLVVVRPSVIRVSDVLSAYRRLAVAMVSGDIKCK